jgi:hypothetical protein
MSTAPSPLSERPPLPENISATLIAWYAAATELVKTEADSPQFPEKLSALIEVSAATGDALGKSAEAMTLRNLVTTHTADETSLLGPFEVPNPEFTNALRIIHNQILARIANSAVKPPVPDVGSALRMVGYVRGRITERRASLLACAQ